MVRVMQGDCRTALADIPDNSIHCCVTSPPYYGLRDYAVEGQIGLEESPQHYVDQMVAVFREVRRVLRPDGTLWLNLGDSYAANRTYQVPSTKGGEKHSPAQSVGGRGSIVPEGLKPKDLIGIPWRVAFALQADGWYLRQDIIWHKPNPMPESVTDRCTKSHEYIFLMSKSPRYFFDAAAIEEPAKWERWGNQTEKKTHPGTAKFLGGKTIAELPIRDKKNKRDVWTVATKPYKGAHFATFNPELITPCILAGTSSMGCCGRCGAPLRREGKDDVWIPSCSCKGAIRKPCVVLDPFGGSGTTGRVAQDLGRDGVLVELNPEYCDLIKERMSK
jgi:DNA modification methylase